MPEPEKTISENSDASDGASGRSRFLFLSAIYLLGDMLTKGARIILLPIYLAVMTQAEIGELAIVQAIIFCSWTILGFGFTYAVHKYYVKYEENGDALVSSLWLARLVGGLPFYGLLLVIGYAFSQFAHGAISWQLVFLAITAGYLRGGINLVEFWFNVQDKPVKHRSFTFCQFLLTTLLVIYLVVFKEMGVLGVVVSELTSYSVFVFVSAFVLFRRSLPKLQAVRWREVIGYCLPALPYNFFMWGLFGVDRLILNEYVPRSEIGIYSIGYTLASCLSIFVYSMRAAWLPSFFKAAEQGAGGKQFKETAYIYFFVILFAGLSVMLFAPEIVEIIGMTAAVSYARSANVMQIVLYAYIANSFFLALNKPLFYRQRTGLISMISAMGLLVNVVVNLWLIPQFGIFGAAVASAVAYTVMAVLAYFVSQKVYPFDWHIRKLIPCFAAFLLFGMIACFLPGRIDVWFVLLKLFMLVTFS